MAADEGAVFDLDAVARTAAPKEQMVVAGGDKRAPAQDGVV